MLISARFERLGDLYEDNKRDESKLQHGEKHRYFAEGCICTARCPAAVHDD